MPIDPPSSPLPPLSNAPVANPVSPLPVYVPSVSAPQTSLPTFVPAASAPQTALPVPPALPSNGVPLEDRILALEQAYGDALRAPNMSGPANLTNQDLMTGDRILNRHLADNRYMLSQPIFYDNFVDSRRYPNGSLVTHGTQPLIGNPWRLNVSGGSMTTDAPVIFANGLASNNQRLFYLGSRVSHPQGKIEINYEFTTTPSRVASPNGSVNFTNISVSPNVNLIPEAGGGIGVSGALHVNLNPQGVTAINLFQTEVSCTIDTATDIITSAAPHNLTTGWPVALNPAVGGTMPAGVFTQRQYFAIVLSPTTFRIAQTQSLALAGTHIDLTTTGNLVTWEHAGWCVNRSGAIQNFFPPTMQSVFFAANAATDIITTFTEFQTGDVVLVQGSGLPAPLVANTEYYINRQGNDIRLSTSRDNAFLGITIDLTTNGNSDQEMFGAATPISQLEVDRRYVVSLGVDGEYCYVEMSGIGRIIYWYPRLAQIFGTQSGFWWEPAQDTGSESIAPVLHAISIGSKAIKEEMLARCGTQLPSGNNRTIVSRPITIQGAPRFRQRILSFNFETGLAIPGNGTVVAGGDRIRAREANTFINGVYAANLGFQNIGAHLIGYSAMQHGIGLNSPRSSIATTESTLHDIGAMRFLALGDKEEFTIYIQLVGAGTKRIRVINSPSTGTEYFNTGTDLDGRSGAGKIRLTRMRTNANTHVVFLEISVNDWMKTYGPAVFTADNFAYRFMSQTADAGGIVFHMGFGETTRMTPSS